MGRTRAACPDGSWPAEAVAKRLRIDRDRLKYLLRALRDEGFGTGRFRCFSVEQILAIGVADRLMSQGVRPAKVRAACTYLRRHVQLGVVPLTAYTFFTDGRTVLVNTKDPAVVIDVAGQGQLVFAMALHDVVLACDRAQFLTIRQPRLKEIVASVKLRWRASRREPVA